jgi:hypothetical protein
MVRVMTFVNAYRERHNPTALYTITTVSVIAIIVSNAFSHHCIKVTYFMHSYQIYNYLNIQRYLNILLLYHFLHHGVLVLLKS